MRLTTSAVWSTHLWNHWPDPEKQLSTIRIGVWGCNIMIWYLYILQNDHHNTHSQTHAQEGESVPEAHSENYPFNGLYLESKENVPWETSLWTRWASTTHKGRNHHHLRAHPPQAGDETPRSWVQLTGLLWRPTTPPTHQTKLDGGGAGALAKSYIKFPWILEERGPRLHSIRKANSPLVLWGHQGVKHALLVPVPWQVQSSEPEDAVFHWWPSRGRWQGRGACQPGAGVVGQLPGWEVQVGYGRVRTVVLWAGQQRSHHPHRVPKGMHYPRRSRTVRWLASTGPRAEHKENTCGVCLHIQLWRHVRTTGWATGRLALPPRSALTRCVNSQSLTSGFRARKRMRASLISWTEGESQRS